MSRRAAAFPCRIRRPDLARAAGCQTPRSPPRTRPAARVVAALATVGLVVLLGLSGAGTARAAEVPPDLVAQTLPPAQAVAAADATGPTTVAVLPQPAPGEATTAEAGEDQTGQIDHPPLLLNRTVEVSGPFVTLGDVFEGVSDKDAPVSIARSPRPGRTEILDSQWLARTAQAYGLDWQPRSSLDQVTLTRPGTAIPTETVLATIREMLTRQGADPNAEIQLNSGRAAVMIPQGAAPDIRVLNEQYDPTTHTFSATLEAPAGAIDAQRLRVAGRIFDTREVPVLVRSLGQGDLIGPYDVEYARLRADTLPSDAILDAHRLIGMTPRTTLHDGRPIRRYDVSRPVMVESGSLVTMELRMPGLTLTAQGRVQEDGAEGDTIRVMNTTSKQVVLGVVAGPNRVIVDSPTAGTGPQTARR